MKLFASISASVALGGFALSLLSTPFAVALYGLAFTACLALILATDYAPRAHRWEPRSLKIANATKPNALQLAA